MKTFVRSSLGITSLLTAIFALLTTACVNAQTPPATHRFERDVLAFEAADKTNPPPKGAILFTGDSQFARWNTIHEDLPDYTVINRGINGSELSDILYFAERIVLPYKPRLIVLHEGGNDLHGGKTAEQVLADLKAFVEKVRAVLPDVPIAFTSVTPSPARWEESDKRKAANKIFQDYIATQKNLMFIDLWDAFVGPDGKPRENLFVADRLHHSHAGYLARVKITRPFLGEPDKKAK